MTKPLTEKEKRTKDDVPIATSYDEAVRDGDDDDDDDELEFEVVEDEEEDEKSEKEDEEEEDDDEGGDDHFDGFDEDRKSDTRDEEIRQLRETVAALQKQMEGGNKQDFSDITPEKFKEIAEKDPVKALQLIVQMEMQNHKAPSPDDLKSDVLDTTRKEQMVREYREKIDSEFDPARNTKLAEAAQKKFKEREKRGITLDKYPDAEYEAFLLARAENPKLAAKPSRASKPIKANSAKGGSKKKAETVRIHKETLRIAKRWGIDPSDKKTMKRIAELRDHFASRRIS